MATACRQCESVRARFRHSFTLILLILAAYTSLIIYTNVTYTSNSVNFRLQLKVRLEPPYCGVKVNQFFFPISQNIYCIWSGHVTGDVILVTWEQFIQRLDIFENLHVISQNALFGFTTYTATK